MDIKYTRDYYVVYIDKDYENDNALNLVCSDEKSAYDYAYGMHKSGHTVSMERCSVAELDF